MMNSILEDKIILAVDIGGTKVAAAAVDVRGRILARCKEPTCQSGPQDGIAQIIRLLEGLLEGAQLQAADCLCIGVGIPAVLEPETDFVIWGPNLHGWRGVDLRGALSRYFGLPAAVEYDGHAAALGEWWVGAGRDCHSFVDVIIGTGIGGGMVLEDRLFRGNNRLAGAAGWFAPLGGSGPGVNDFTRDHLGYWETMAAGPGVAAHAMSLLDQYPGSVLAALPGSASIEVQHIFSAAAEEDPLALRVAHDLAVLMGRGAANIISLVNPQVIIFGGGVGAHCQFLLPAIQSEITRWAQPISAEAVELVISSLGPDAGLLGAAYGGLLRIQSTGKGE